MSYISRLFKRITNRDYLSQLSNDNGSDNNKPVETQCLSSNQDNIFITYSKRTSYQPINDYFHRNKLQGSASIYLDNYNHNFIENTIFGKTGRIDTLHKTGKFGLGNSSVGHNPMNIAIQYDEARINRYNHFLNIFGIYDIPTVRNIPDDINRDVSPQKTDITQVGEYGKKHKINEITLPDGTVVLGHRCSNFNKCQEQWLDLQKYMVQAANELGLTLVYSDVCRPVSASNKARAEKGNHVAPGKSSPHNYGVAADIILLKDGKRIKEKPNKHEQDLQAQFAQRVSDLSGGKIAWGGDKEYYPTLYKKERHHFELRDWNKKDSENYCKNRDNLINKLV